MKQRIKDGPGESIGEGLWLRAEKQSGGKGRLGRAWESPEGNLYCSTLVEIRPGEPPPATLSFVTALAVHDLLCGQLGRWGAVQLKWPNDLLVMDAKICGILLERVENMVVVGIGINVTDAPDLPDRKTTSIHQVNGQNANSPAQVLKYLIPRFENRVEQWRVKGLPYILNDWQKRAHKIGSSLVVTGSQGDQILGEYEGLTLDGALRLRKADGELIEVHAGDVEMTRATENGKP